MLKNAGLTPDDKGFEDALGQARYAVEMALVNPECSSNRCRFGFKECVSCYCFADAVAYTFVRHGVGVTIGDVIEELKRGPADIWDYIDDGYEFFDMTEDEARKFFLQDVDRSAFGLFNRMLILPDLSKIS